MIEPATGELLITAPAAAPSDVERAAEAAAAAQPGWSRGMIDERAAVMRRAATLLDQRRESFVDWLVRESGSTSAKAGAEVVFAHDQLVLASALPHQTNGDLYPSNVPGRTNFVRRVPMGVVGVITPWNFPLVLAIRSLAPAIALGNSVVLKPDTQTCVSGGLMIAELFRDAGLPEGVLQVIPGGAEVGAALVDHPRISMISFTGSTATGQSIGERCGRLLKKTALELGGNNALIVLDDADVELAASSGAWGSFLHQGQNCMATGRHLVHRSVADRYIDSLVRRAKRLRVGNPSHGEVDIGPLINTKQLSRLRGIIDRSVASGATILTGGDNNGLYFEPTVLTNVSPDCEAFTAEIFGPVAPVTIFDSDEEAIDLVNSSPYGLALGIHTASLGRGLRLADAIRTGMVHINDHTVNTEMHVPFGGRGISSNGGRFGGQANLSEFTELQWISMIKAPYELPF